jgi:hypothetical protein
VSLSRPKERSLVRESVARRLRIVSAFDLLLYGFIVVGLFLRAWAIDAMEFKSDEFRDILNTYRASRSPWSAPLLAAEGTTVSPGTFFYQFLALPASVTTDPVDLTIFIALLEYRRDFRDVPGHPRDLVAVGGPVGHRASRDGSMDDRLLPQDLEPGRSRAFHDDHPALRDLGYPSV